MLDHHVTANITPVSESRKIMTEENGKYTPFIIVSRYEAFALTFLLILVGINLGYVGCVLIWDTDSTILNKYQTVFGSAVAAIAVLYAVRIGSRQEGATLAAINQTRNDQRAAPVGQMLVLKSALIQLEAEIDAWDPNNFDIEIAQASVRYIKVALSKVNPLSVVGALRTDAPELIDKLMDVDFEVCNYAEFLGIIDNKVSSAVRAEDHIAFTDHSGEMRIAGSNCIFAIKGYIYELQH